MLGVRIKDMFFDFGKSDFKCPHCLKDYNDGNDVYLKRCNKNKSNNTKINCSCGKVFYMTYDITSEAVSFV